MCQHSLLTIQKEEHAASIEGSGLLHFVIMFVMAAFEVKRTENFGAGIPSYRYHVRRECQLCGPGPILSGVFREQSQIDLSPEPPVCGVCSGTGYVSF